MILLKMRIKTSFVVPTIIGLASGSQCLVSKLDTQRPDTSCCDMTDTVNRCLFTSSCNPVGVCC